MPDIASLVVKDKELHYALTHNLAVKPKIVITDSQVFLKVNADVPPNILDDFFFDTDGQTKRRFRSICTWRFSYKTSTKQ